MFVCDSSSSLWTDSALVFLFCVWCFFALSGGCQPNCSLCIHVLHSMQLSRTEIATSGPITIQSPEAAHIVWSVSSNSQSLIRELNSTLNASVSTQWIAKCCSFSAMITNISGCDSIPFPRTEYSFLEFLPCESGNTAYWMQTAIYVCYLHMSRRSAVCSALENERREHLMYS